MEVSSLLGQTCARTLHQGGLSPDLTHHDFTMLLVELGLSPSDGEVRKVPTAPKSEGQKNAAKHDHFSGQWWEMWWILGGPPSSPSTRIIMSHDPPPPRDTSLATYPGHRHLVGLHVEVGGPHLIQGSIVQLLQAKTPEWVTWMQTGATGGCGGSQVTTCDQEDIERDLIFLILEGNYGGDLTMGNG